MATTRPALRRLAERAGILSAHEPAGGGPPRRISDATREAILAALGFDASSEEAARAGLRALAEEQAEARRRAGPGPAEKARAWSVRDALGGRGVFGLWTNLYTLRSARNLGIGDLGDVRRLVRLAAEAGAAFVGLSPLHALRNADGEISPYAPVSRLFRNAAYLDPDAVPEADDAGYRALRESGRVRDEVAALREGDRIDPERAARLKEELSAALHGAFRRREGGGSARRRAYERWRESQGAALDRFAGFRALQEAQAREGGSRDPARWPEPLRDARSPQVARFCEAHAEAVDRHRFVQFELDRQLAAAAGEAREAGMPLGLYTDLAIGSQGAGFDPWAWPHLFVKDVSVGAPPDEYSEEGQDWGFPPLHPWWVAEDDYAFLRRLLAANMAHAGALRIDHAMWFFRLWWVPRGMRPSEGAYVRYPAEALLRVASEESRRARALLIGEDLGTVPRQVPPTLGRFGALSSRVLLFEREKSGRFKPASQWSPRALATANTHDLATLRAWIEGDDLRLRRELGLIADDEALAAAREERRGAREALRRRLRRGGHLRAGEGAPGWAAWARAAHSFLCATPAPLVGLSLDDLCGEVLPVNVPGVGPETYPSWTRRMGRALEAMADAPGFAEALSGAASRGARAGAAATPGEPAPRAVAPPRAPRPRRRPTAPGGP